LILIGNPEIQIWRFLTVISKIILGRRWRGVGKYNFRYPTDDL